MWCAKLKIETAHIGIQARHVGVQEGFQFRDSSGAFSRRSSARAALEKALFGDSSGAFSGRSSARAPPDPAGPNVFFFELSWLKEAMLALSAFV